MPCAFQFFLSEKLVFLALYCTERRKKLSPKTQNFSKKFESRQKAALREWIFGYFICPRRKADSFPAATSSTGRA